MGTQSPESSSGRNHHCFQEGSLSNSISGKPGTGADHDGMGMPLKCLLLCVIGLVGWEMESKLKCVAYQKASRDQYSIELEEERAQEIII